MSQQQHQINQLLTTNLDRSIKIPSFTFSTQNTAAMKEYYFLVVARLRAKRFTQCLLNNEGDIDYANVHLHPDADALLYAELIANANSDFKRMIAFQPKWKNKGTQIMLYLFNLFHKSPLDKRSAEANYKQLLSIKCNYPTGETIEQFTARFCHLLSKLEDTEYQSIIQDPYYTRKYYIQALPSPIFEDLKKQALIDQVLPDDWKDLTNPSEFIMAAAD